MAVNMVRENSSVPAQLRSHGDSVSRQLFHALKANGGGTVDLLTMRTPAATSGYFVGSAPGWNGEPIETRVMRLDTLTLEGRGGFRETFAHMYADHLTRTELESSTPVRGYIGVWEDAGMVYMDAVTWVASHAEAVRLGWERNETAIYGVAENASLYLADFPKPLTLAKSVA